jgi:hypothetical protein
MQNNLSQASVATEALARGDLLEGGIVHKDNATRAANQAAPNGNGAGINIPSDIKSKRPRRTKADVTRLRAAIKALLEESRPQTVRQIFYALTVRGLIAKSQNEYRQTVVRLLVEMRENGEIPFSWIADHTRWMRAPVTYSGPGAGIRALAKGYRRDLWLSAPHHVEIWCKKDALAGVIIEETSPYAVPLMVARGYSSLTYLHETAKTIDEIGKPAYLYHFGDHDPSGQDAARDIEEKIRRYAPRAEIHFERVAVTLDQIEKWDLPSRPPKTNSKGEHTDKRQKKFGTKPIVELDAISAENLRTLVRDRIERHVNKRELEILKVAETSEREGLERIAKIYAGAV